MFLKRKEDESTRQIKMIFLVGLLFLMSAWMSCTEVKYGIGGKQAEAKVVSVKKVMNPSRHGSMKVMAVKYAWSEKGGTARTDVVNVEIDQAPALGDILAIDFLPGVHGSRMQVRWNYIAVTFFLVMLGIGLFVVGRVV
ncbi:MAG: hypothetical protein IPK83_14900 [Planctomycetes bacterium]|nr:hypothetical protein [Planctomycetota bacterium]